MLKVRRNQVAPFRLAQPLSEVPGAESSLPAADTSCDRQPSVAPSSDGRATRWGHRRWDAHAPKLMMRPALTWSPRAPEVAVFRLNPAVAEHASRIRGVVSDAVLSRQCSSCLMTTPFSNACAARPVLSSTVPGPRWEYCSSGRVVAVRRDVQCDGAVAVGAIGDARVVYPRTTNAAAFLPAGACVPAPAGPVRGEGEDAVRNARAPPTW